MASERMTEERLMEISATFNRSAFPVMAELFGELRRERARADALAWAGDVLVQLVDFYFCATLPYGDERPTEQEVLDGADELRKAIAGASG